MYKIKQSERNHPRKATRKYYVSMLALLPFLLLIGTGIVLLLYHTNKPETATTLGLSKSTWLTVHQTSSVLSIILIATHLVQHFNWFKKVLTGKLKSKNKEMNLTLLALFLLAMITGLSSWLWVDDEKATFALLSIHNKFGLLMIVLFGIHLKNYFTWLVSMTKKLRKK